MYFSDSTAKLIHKRPENALDFHWKNYRSRMRTGFVQDSLGVHFSVTMDFPCANSSSVSWFVLAYGKSQVLVNGVRIALNLQLVE